MLDPNSDFVRLGELRDGVDDDVASRYRQATEGIVVRTVGRGPERLHVRFRDFDPVEQAAVLRLDPIRNRDEYGALVEILEGGLKSPFTTAGELAERLATAEVPEYRALATRMRNLGLHQWPVWSVEDPGSLQDLVAPGGPRALIVDLGSLDSAAEKAIAAEARSRGSLAPTRRARAGPHRHRRGAQRVPTRAGRRGYGAGD